MITLILVREGKKREGNPKRKKRKKREEKGVDQGAGKGRKRENTRRKRNVKRLVGAEVEVLKNIVDTEVEVRAERAIRGREM